MRQRKADRRQAEAEEARAYAAKVQAENEAREAAEKAAQQKVYADAEAAAQVSTDKYISLVEEILSKEKFALFFRHFLYVTTSKQTWKRPIARFVTKITIETRWSASVVWGSPPAIVISIQCPSNAHQFRSSDGNGPHTPGIIIFFRKSLFVL